MRKSQFSRIALPFIFFLLISCVEQPNEIVDVKRFQEKDNWQVFSDFQSKDSGFVKLKSEKWLMYFIHWRPLTDKNQEISIDYTRNLILNLWGPSMPFTLKTGGGRTKINGHEAYYADGTLNNGMVKTRFYVWNCPETNRQFIADCNYNLKRKTPKKLFDIQCNVSTPSIECHNSESIGTEEPGFKYFQSEKLNLSFKLPESWNAKEFVFPKEMQKNSGIPGMYPNGVTDSLGSILSLMKDSERTVILKWKNSKNVVSFDKIENELHNLINDSIIEIYDSVEYVQKIENLEIEDRVKNNKSIILSGIYNSVYEQVGGGYTESNPYIFRAYLYKRKGNIYFLFTSMVAYKEFWFIDFDLKPTIKEYNKFINDEIVPNILYFGEEVGPGS